MKNALNIVLNFIVFPAFAILLLYLSFHGIDLKVIWNDLLKANYSWVLLSLVFAIIGFYFRALRWQLLLQSVQYYPPIRTTFYAVIMAYFANMAIPRIGEITRCATLHKTNQIPIDVSFGTVITERVIDIITLCLVILSVLVIDFSFFSSFFEQNILNYISEKISSSSIYIYIFALALISIIVLIVIFKTKLQQFKVFKKTTNFIKGILQGILSVIKLKKRMLFLLYTFLIWLCYALMTYVVFFAIPSTSHLSFSDSLFVLSIGGLGMSAPVQNGFGAFHWIVSRGLMLYGISQADGLLYATLCHESQTLMILLFGPITMLLIMLYVRKHQQKI
ncbi:MAG: flippase-like domain-containing protein [Bacteroidales bacterium]|nr:flippase-like domain-containing protein [Bacteroidales bacterium]